MKSTSPATSAPSSRSAPQTMSLALQRISNRITCWTGTSSAFLLAFGSVLLWLACGSWFHYSDTWQLVMNTATSIITFLMVFLIQRAQNKDAMVIQIKLNELIAAQQGASNRLIDIEDLSEEALMKLHIRYQILAQSVTAATESSRLSASPTPPSLPA